MSKTKRGDFEEQLRSLQQDIGLLSQKLAIPCKITKRFVYVLIVNRLVPKEDSTDRYRDTVKVMSSLGWAISYAILPGTCGDRCSKQPQGRNCKIEERYSLSDTGEG